MSDYAIGMATGMMISNSTNTDEEDTAAKACNCDQPNTQYCITYCEKKIAQAQYDAAHPTTGLEIGIIAVSLLIAAAIFCWWVAR